MVNLVVAHHTSNIPQIGIQQLKNVKFSASRNPLSLKTLLISQSLQKCRFLHDFSSLEKRNGISDARSALSEYQLGFPENAEHNFGSGYGILYGVPERGSPDPFGATAVNGGVNFAISSSTATAVILCLFTTEDLKQGQVSAEIPLHPILNRTGSVWHIFLPSISADLAYGYKLDGRHAPEEGVWHDPLKIILDPYAKAVISRSEYGVPGFEGDCWPQMAGAVPANFVEEFDWQGDTPPRLNPADLIIYEMHVRGYTQHPSSNVEFPGTFLGLAEKLQHLKKLGVNAIELLPVHEFNELEYYAYNHGSGTYRLNFWGYSTINFFSPMARYSTTGGLGSGPGRGPIDEFKTLVREAHKLGMEVILDVVFNHTAEGNEMGPTLSFRGLDNRVFYMVAPKGEFYNYSGCGNTVNCNHPFVRNFIVDCLRYWVVEMHVDGFRFDLAAILTRASSLWDASSVYGSPTGDGISTGAPLDIPPVVEMISNDPVLRGVKLIAEAWDAGGLYQVGSFPHWGIWAEWNGQFRDTVRQFVKGTDGVVGDFARMLCGSPHLYEGGRKPYHSVNFVTAHDGFTLADTVSFNEKHNISNGENNNDGENHNYSWNCGQEGVHVSKEVQTLRQRQMRNLLLALFVSQGVPMILMGDEYGHSKDGNNNTYCHDSPVNYFRWDKLGTDTDGFNRFFRKVVKFRKEMKCFGLSDFPTAGNLTWHGTVPNQPDWSESSRFIAYSIKGEDDIEVYIAFNASHLPVFVGLPEQWGFKWSLLVDTSKPTPYDYMDDDVADREAAEKQYEGMLAAHVYPMLSYSSIVLVRQTIVV